MMLELCKFILVLTIFLEETKFQLGDKLLYGGGGANWGLRGAVTPLSHSKLRPV